MLTCVTRSKTTLQPASTDQNHAANPLERPKLVTGKVGDGKFYRPKGNHSVTTVKKIDYFAKFALVMGCCVATSSAPGQQAASSVRSGTTTSRSSTAHAGSTAGGSRVRTTGSGGSSWTAGRESFSAPGQKTGGIWSDGSTLGASTGAPHGPTSGGSGHASSEVSGGRGQAPTTSRNAAPINAALNGGTTFHVAQPAHSALGSHRRRPGSALSARLASHGGRSSLGSSGGSRAMQGGPGSGGRTKASSKSPSGSSSMPKSNLRQGNDSNSSPFSRRQRPSRGERKNSLGTPH
jgi:hypothetical protein